MKTTLFLALFACILSIPVFAQLKANNTFYVSAKGNDRDEGTFKKPFKSIQKAADVMHAGDICYIRQGIYREKITLPYDGTEKAPIRFTCYKKDTVVITATRLVNQFIPFKGRIYKAFCPDSIIQVFYNQQESPLASFPEITNKLNADEWADASIDTNGVVTFKNNQFATDYWKGAYCRLLTGKKWIAHIGKVVSGNNNVLQCINSENPFNKLSSSVYLGAGKACIIGHLNALDHDHEWMWQNDTLYYYVPAALDATSLSIECRTHYNAIQAEDRKHIQISGLHFFAASLDFRNAENCLIENGSVQYPSPIHWYGSGWGRQLNYKTDKQATDKWPGKGVYITGNDNLIRNMYIAHSWGDGVSLGGVNNTVNNCFIEDCDWSMTDCAAISATGYKLKILNSTCRVAARSIIVHRFADKIDIMGNHLYDAGLGTDDLGLTYAYESNGDSAQIAWNWVHDNHAEGTSTGIYLDNFDTAFIVHHNVVWNCTYGIQTNKDAVNHQIYNNTLFNCKNPSWAWGPAGTSVQGQKVYNNLSEEPFLIGNDLKNNIIDSKKTLVDIDNLDFRLQKKAKAIDAGIVIKDISESYHGKAPDAGAYEFGGKAWKAGCNITPVTRILPVIVK